jgi:hypothetical protein
MCELQHDHFLLLQSRCASPRHGAFELAKEKMDNSEDGPRLVKKKK